MAEPAHQLPEDIQPEIRPKLGVIQGGGEGDGTPQGELHGVDGGGLPTPEELRGTEEAGNPNLTGIDGGGEGGGRSSRDAGLKAVGEEDEEVEPADKPTRRQRLRAKAGVSRRRRMLLGGGITGGIVSAVLVGLSFSSGPLEFIHFAHLLESAHFGAQEDQSDNRFFHEVRYLRSIKTGTSQRTRLSYLGNKYADRIDAKLESVGLKSIYSDTFIGKLYGFHDGFEVDKSYPKYRNMTPDQIAENIKGEFGVAAEVKDGHVVIPGSELGFFKGRAFVKAQLSSLGESGVRASIGAHVAGKRFGWTWHPMKNLDSYIAKSIDKWWQQRNNADENGAEPIEATGENDTNPKDNSPGGAADSVAAGAEAQSLTDTAGEAKAAGQALSQGDTGPITALQEHIGTKLALGGTAAVGILCLGRSIAGEADTIKYTQVVLPLSREGIEAISLGNQVESGKDVNLSELGKFQSLMYDSQNNTSAFQAQSVEADAGEPQNGPPPDKTLQTISKGTPFDVLTIGTLGSLLDGACSKAGQVVTGVIGFLGGPVSFITGTVISAVVGPPLIGDFTHWMAGSAVDILKAGRPHGYQADYGTFIAADQNAVANGGTAMSNADANTLTAFESSQDKQAFEKQGLAYRLFSPTDPHSLLANMIDYSAPTVTGNLVRVTNGLADLGHSLFSSFLGWPATFLGGTAHAAGTGTYDYGLPTYGFTQAEMDNSSVDNPFQNGDHVADILDSSSGQDYINKASDCFGVNIVKDNTGAWDVQSDTTNQGQSQDNYFGKDYTSKDCASPSGLDANDWLAVRFFIFDTNTMKSEACLDGDNQSCQDEGVDSSSSDSTSSSTPTTTGNVDGGSDAQLAQKLLDYRKSGKYSCDNSGDCADLQKMVSGTSLAGSEGCTADKLDPRVLQLLLYLIENGNFKIGTFAMCGDHSNDGPNGHSGGFAVDISSVDGVSVATDSPQAKTNTLKLDQFLNNNLPSQIQLRQQISYGYGNHPDADLASTQQDAGKLCNSSCVSIYTLAVEQEHENHVHAGY